MMNMANLFGGGGFAPMQAAAPVQNPEERYSVQLQQLQVHNNLSFVFGLCLIIYFSGHGLWQPGGEYSSVAASEWQC
jgi:hypothetical protein